MGTLVAGARSGAQADASSADRPPDGTASLFDRLLAQAGGVPFPFERLIESVAAFGADAGRPALLLVPDGRSLVRHETSFESPRVLLAAGAEPVSGNAAGGTAGDLVTRNRLFVGFAEAAGEIEVISWNEAAGRFEFQVIRDYRPGATPTVTYAPRGFCFGCHQNEGPLFSRRPWGETNAHGAVAEAIARARGASVGSRYQGVPLKVPLREAELFDGLVAEANVLLAAQTFWRAGCGGDGGDGGEEAEECRRLLLAQALSFRWDPALFDAGNTEMLRLAALQARLRPPDGLALADGQLPNRDPPLDASRSWAPLSWLGLAGTGREEVPPELDPKSLRPTPRTVDSGIHAVAASFGPGDVKDLKAWSMYPEQVLDLVSEKLPAALFGRGPLDRGAVVRALADPLGKRLEIACCAGGIPSPSQVTAATAPLALAAGSDLQPFVRYCFSCHRGAPVRRLDFMRGSTPDEVWANIVATPRMAEVLDWERLAGTPREPMMMPPRYSQEYTQLAGRAADGADERRALRSALAGHGY